MFDNLTTRLSRVVKTLRGEARITEDNIQDALREVRMALLEADVALPVVRTSSSGAGQGARPGGDGQSDARPGVVGVVHRELTALMGERERGARSRDAAARRDPDGRPAGLAARRRPAASSRHGLQEQRKKKVLLVSADVYRPAAIEQLADAGATGRTSEFFPSAASEKPVDIATRGARHARAPLSRRADRRHGRPARDRRGDDARDRASCTPR